MKQNTQYDLSRRGSLRSLIGGSMLLPGIVSQLLAEEASSAADDPLAPKSTHFPAKAKPRHPAVHERWSVAYRFLGS